MNSYTCNSNYTYKKELVFDNIDGSLEQYQNNNLKIVLIFSIFLGKDTSFYNIKKGTNFSFFGQKY